MVIITYEIAPYKNKLVPTEILDYSIANLPFNSNQGKINFVYIKNANFKNINCYKKIS